MSKKAVVGHFTDFDVVWDVYENEPENEILLSQFEKPGVGREWMWCLHCGRVYRFGDFKIAVDATTKRKDKRMKKHLYFVQGNEGILFCPHEGCDGDYLFDRWPWRDRKAPDLGKVYQHPCHDDINLRPSDYVED